MKKPLPSPNLMRKLLRYEPDTGKLFWLERSIDLCISERALAAFNAQFAGKEAFTADNGDGYRCSYLFGRTMRAHRVIWAIVYGDWPKDQVDHINGVRSDNRICNLRAATHSQNAHNARHSSLNTSGFRGVHRVYGRDRWQARITFNGKRISLGVYQTPEEAHDAYRRASKQYHGEFGRA
jgi:hypothetical protein